jgi:hypothetical protein
MKPVICPYCGEPTEYTSSANVYNGTHYGMIYLCSPCNAYVGVHRNSRKALGIPANKELREARTQLHLLFDPIWRNGCGVSRSQAYHWLASEMNIPVSECHIGMFNLEYCKMATKIIQERKGICQTKSS